MQYQRWNVEGKAVVDPVEIGKVHRLLQAGCHKGLSSAYSANRVNFRLLTCHCEVDVRLDWIPRSKEGWPVS